MNPQIAQRIANVKTNPPSDDALAHEAVLLAADLLHEAKRQQNSTEKAQQAKIAGMMEDPNGKLMTMALSDQAFRSHDPARIADQIKHLLAEHGVPKYFANWEQIALQLGSMVGQYIPQLVVPFIVAKLRAETKSVILPSEEKELRSYLQERRATGTRLNLNQLGEAILGEEEARRRLDSYLQLLTRPDVEYISVKISSVFSQINLVDFHGTVEEIKSRLRELYRQAMRYEFVPAEGTAVPKFINLDMEEYRDLHLTVAAFQQVLDEPEFMKYRAGIVLQAYLPDSHPVQRELTAWAKARVARGGATIKIRIVKGANLAMEKVEASWHDWAQAPYTTKADVDANYKRMLIYGCQPENAAAVHLGIASHNLFDLAYGLLIRAKYGVEQYAEFEMLEGMANHQARTVQEAAGGLLLYAPVVKQEDFHSAISYLVRRLDENTAPENFLHDLFGLEVGSPSWERQKQFFLEAVRRRDEAPQGPNRLQNRPSEQPTFDPSAPFHNVADTDFSLPANQQWAAQILATWREKAIEPLPLQIGGEFISANTAGEGHDPSRPEIIAYQYALARPEHIEAALSAAVEAQASWASTPIAERKKLLVACAEELARRRGDLVGAAVLDGGKAIPEADSEVSEAIDFANYYARALDLAETELADVQMAPLGTVLITPPWNFPIAIPCGGVLAGLMAGNTVIIKPAPEAVLVAWEMCKALWEAGIPKEALQFVPTTDDEVGRSLVTDGRINAVILTGAYSTGRMFLGWKPELRLLAETSGKNSLIISGMADHDQAIKDLVKSAFGHNGQKCSAASLAVLEAEVYDNPAFLRQLRDATASLHVGSAWELSSKVTPIIREPGAELARGLTQLDEGESWLLEPKMVDGNPNLWSPGIKLGVKRGSWYHQNECFGPVLGLIRAKNLADAIEIVNDSELGLTSGLHTLDEREIAIWREKIEVGNAYINRGTTGAIVQRQPFGGWKKSVFGAGSKAGGPNYVLSLGRWTVKANAPAMPTAEWSSAVDELLQNALALVGVELSEADGELLRHTAGRYAHAWLTHFSLEHDSSGILGETNVFRYRPLKKGMLLRLEKQGNTVKALQAAIAAQTCGTAVQLSVSSSAQAITQLDKVGGMQVFVEGEEGFVGRLKSATADRLRVFTEMPRAVRVAAIEAHIPLVEEPVVSNGRLELRYYLHEQAISETTHRYGNVVGKK
ncbi:MAG: proline dehydrogenase family protein [Chloroflexi bacterium]|nr:proline dehydrogenase family protein [Chloroflexota bacterium]